MRRVTRRLKLCSVDIVAKPDQRHRKEERVGTALPVDLGTAAGTTRDVSASGIFFETDASHALSNAIRFTVALDTPSGKMMLRCRGDIVRIEPRDRKLGVAVKITESVMEPA